MRRRIGLVCFGIALGLTLLEIGMRIGGFMTMSHLVERSS
jgi:hypothetical protein